MASIGNHLVRRAFDVTQEHINSPTGSFRAGHGVNPADEPQDDTHKRWAIFGVALFWVTAIIYMAIMSAISYTYGDVVATLAMVETPTATAFQIESDESLEAVDAPLLSEEQKSEKMKLVESDLFLVKQQPITAKLRTAVKHLKQQGGRWARFRGLHVAIVYHFIHSLIVQLFTSKTSNPLIRSFVVVATTIVLCRLQMTWTHIVISAPSTKRWWRRFPSVKAGKNIIVPTAVYAIACQAAVYVPAALFVPVYDQLQNPSTYGKNPDTVQKMALVEVILVGLIAIGTVVLIVIPANVTLKRCQSAMLPEEDETIVPFDRTFAGKVKPEILGGSGAVGMLDAWKSFDRSARVRLIKLYAKVFAIQAAVSLMFVFVVIGELRLLLGDQMMNMMRIAHANFKGQQ